MGEEELHLLELVQKLELARPAPTKRETARPRPSERQHQVTSRFCGREGGRRDLREMTHLSLSSWGMTVERMVLMSITPDPDA